MRDTVQSITILHQWMVVLVSHTYIHIYSVLEDKTEHPGHIVDSTFLWPQCRLTESPWSEAFLGY